MGAGKLAVEIRGVNHRFLDVRVRVPRELGDLASVRRAGGAREAHARPLRGGRARRRRWRSARRCSTATARAPPSSALTELRDELAPGSDVPLSLLGAIPDLFVLVGRARDRARCADATRDGVRGGGRRRSTRCARARGRRSREDLVKRLERVRQLAREVERARARRRRGPPQAPARARRAPAGRRRSSSVDPARLEQEIAHVRRAQRRRARS